MTVQDFVLKHHIPDVFAYAAVEERAFDSMASDSGYRRRTTFFSDLSIAEWCGIDSIKDTFNNVCKNWINNVEYFTEFVMSLNWKCWEWSSRNNDELVKLYISLYEEAYDKGIDTYKDKERQYFFETLD